MTRILKLLFVISCLLPASAVAKDYTLVAPLLQLGGGGFMVSGETWWVTYHFEGPGTFTPHFYSTAGAGAQPTELPVYGWYGQWQGGPVTLGSGQVFDGKITGICVSNNPYCPEQIFGNKFNKAWGTIDVAGADGSTRVRLAMAGAFEYFASPPTALAAYRASDGLSPEWAARVTTDSTIGVVNYTNHDTTVRVLFIPDAQPTMTTTTALAVPAWGQVQLPMTATGVAIVTDMYAYSRLAAFQYDTTGTAPEQQEIAVRVAKLSK